MGRNQLLEKIDLNKVEKCYSTRIVYVCVLGHVENVFITGYGD